MAESVILQNMFRITGIYQWLGITLIFSMIFTSLNAFLFKELFKVDISKKQYIKILLLDGTTRFISSIVIPFPYYRMINLFISAICYRIILKQNIEKCILGEVINSISFLIAELIFSKILCLVFQGVSSYREVMYDYKYKFALLFAISMFKLLICVIVYKKNLSINIAENLKKAHKNAIIIISIIGTFIIFFNTLEMTMYITDFPYIIFVIDIVSLLLYFYISISNIVKITQLEKQDMEIHNLETYNKTLSIMYDSIRGFRHDFYNVIQALNGYVQSNDMDGIRRMSSAILKECKDVNNLGILDPNIINNPAIYSVITNKYYLANEKNILMNIEVMIDLKEVEKYIYELCRILSILLDNAIEAAEKCDEKIINVRFVKDIKSNKKLIIIENSYNETNIDIGKIFEKGYTTKNNINNEHGLGLWNVRKILERTNKLNLFTTKGDLFCQQIEIYSTKIG